jgi:arabinose-5-phosphate isomerase
LDGDRAAADEFEDCEEEAEHFGAGAALEEAGEGETGIRGLFLQVLDDVFGVELDGGIVVGDLVVAEAVEVDAGDDRGEGVDEVDEGDIFELDILGGGEDGFAEFIVIHAGAGGGEALLPLLAAVVEGFGGVAELFVGEELLDEVGAGVGGVGGFDGIGDRGAGLGGGEHARLDFHQRRGHDEELPGEFDVDGVYGLEVGDVLVGDGGHGDIGDVDLGAADEKEEEVEGTFEGFEADSVVGGQGRLRPHGCLRKPPVALPGRLGRCTGVTGGTGATRGTAVYPYRMPDGRGNKEERGFAEGVLRAEAAAVAGLVETLGDEFFRAVELIEKCADSGGTVLVTGLGKSGLIGAKMSATLASLGIPSHAVHPSEAAHGDLGRFRPTDTVICLSYSGETDEVVNLAAVLRQDGLPIVVVTGRRHKAEDTRQKAEELSSLERLATVCLSIGAVDEAAEFSAPTCSTTAMLALGDALALCAARRRKFTDEDFAKRHPGGALGGLLRPLTEALRFTVGKNLPLIPETVTVLQALERAEEMGRRPGAMLIVDGAGKLAGIFTDGDLHRLILRDRGELNKPIAAVMTKRPRSLSADALVRDAVKMVRESRLDEIPVVDGEGRPVGILDVQDLVAMKLVRD